MNAHRITLASVTATLMGLASLAPLSPAQAADFGGNCCADLEERIAELEATAARKGNRKVSLQVYGHINQAILFWDDGGEDNAYIVDNQNDQSNFGFTGGAEVSNDLTVGYSLLIRLQRNLSGEVSQDDDDTDLENFLIWESDVFVESKTLGRVTLGQASRVSDGAPEHDLSETALAGYAGVQDIGGGMALRRSGDGALIGLGWGDIYSHLNGDTANLIRYDTPTFAGFTFSATRQQYGVPESCKKLKRQTWIFTLAIVTTKQNSILSTPLVSVLQQRDLKISTLLSWALTLTSDFLPSTNACQRS